MNRAKSGLMQGSFCGRSYLHRAWYWKTIVSQFASSSMLPLANDPPGKASSAPGDSTFYCIRKQLQSDLEKTRLSCLLSTPRISRVLQGWVGKSWDFLWTTTASAWALMDGTLAKLFSHSARAFCSPGLSSQWNLYPRGPKSVTCHPYNPVSSGLGWSSRAWI